MTLSDLASASTAVSGIAVPLSLMVLAVQTRQNARHTRALIQQGLTARTTAIVLANMDADASAAWIEGNGEEPTKAEVRKVQFQLLCASAVSAMFDLHLQHRDGLLSDEQFQRECVRFRGLLSQPGMRAHWLEVRSEIGKGSPKFCAFVDGLAVGEATQFTFKV